MNKIVMWVRKRFEKRLMKFLCVLKKNVFVVETIQQQGIIFQNYSLEVRGHLWGFIPIFGLKKGKQISLSDLVCKPNTSVYKSLATEIGHVPAQVLRCAEESLARSAKQRIGRSKAAIVKSIEDAFKRLGEQSLATFIKTDRNKFRQQLLEKLGKEATSTFAIVAKNHLAELVLRIKDDLQEDGVGNSKQHEQFESSSLPSGTRFVFGRGKMRVFVIEQAPMKRTLQIMNGEGGRAEKIELSFPYVIFFAVMRDQQFDKLYVLFRKAPLRKVTDELLCPAFANVHSDFKVCFVGPSSQLTVSETVEAAINNFWGGRFKLSDLPEYLTSQIKLSDWERRSRQDSLFGLSFSWRSADKTVKSMLDELTKEFVEETRRRRVSGPNLSALQKSVDQIVTGISQKTQEVCFGMVSEWKIEPEAQKQISAVFAEVVKDVCLLAQTELTEDIQGVLSEKVLKLALERAVEKASKMLVESEARVAVFAREALTKFINTEELS